ncbi:hypothetical protein AHAS_Ahas18G0220700 [Arachis hypogaea]
MFGREPQLIQRVVCTLYNVAQEFVNGDDEVDMLHAALDDARVKLVDYRAKLLNKTVANVHTSIATETFSVVATEDIQDPSKVTTKGRPKGKKLGYELEKSIKKSIQRKRKRLDQDNRVESCGNIDLDAPARQIGPQGLGGCMPPIKLFLKYLEYFGQ